MLLHHLYEADLRRQIVDLNDRLPARWRDRDGSVAHKNPRLDRWLAKEPDEALPEIIAHYQELLAYLKANPKAKMSDPYVIRRSRAELTTLRILLERSGRKFAGWTLELYKDDPETLKQCQSDPTCMIDMLVEYLSNELSIQVLPSGLVTFYHLDRESQRLIGDLPVALYHFTSSRVLRSIREHGLESDRNPVNDRVNPGVYLTTEQSGPAVQGYVRRAVAHHGGHGIMLTVMCHLNELTDDEDDADISSGLTQFTMDHVPPDRIVKSERVGL